MTPEKDNQFEVFNISSVIPQNGTAGGKSIFRNTQPFLFKYLSNFSKRKGLQLTEIFGNLIIHVFLLQELMLMYSLLSKNSSFKILSLLQLVMRIYMHLVISDMVTYSKHSCEKRTNESL